MTPRLTWFGATLYHPLHDSPLSLIRDRYYRLHLADALDRRG